jgi:ketosteroid isomerase-like protein
MSKWLLALAVVLATSVPSFAADKKQTAGGSIADQIKALDQQSREAALKGDANFLEKHLADSYVSISGNGQQMDKAQVIQSRKNGDVKYDSIDLKSQKVRVYGNTAVVDDDAMVKATANGQPVSGEYRATFVWVKQGNDWKLVQFQSTPVESSTAAKK